MSFAVSPKSYANLPFVRVGQAAGSVARNRMSAVSPRSFPAMNA